MNTSDCSQQSEDFQRIEKAIQFIEQNFKSQPSLDQMAQSVHLSKYHFDRLFKRWAGISPIQFMQFMTLDYTKKRLVESKSLLETAMDAGLSGTGRLHDLFVTFEAMTPGEFKKQGSGLQISYGVCDSPFGECLLATTQRGICYFGFVASGERSETFGQLFDTWPDSEFIENPTAVCSIVNHIFRINHQKSAHPFNLQVKGTNFQINVWKALLNIPKGCVVSYQDIASYIGHPKAFRAVANAIAVNPVAYLIPCHRVIAKSGKIHQYRWGSARKKALIGWEAVRSA
ncbi:methylated-DNA--protein-cysteine methyltransferase [Desulfosarcina alkanivorans]|uniref:methylated-DNA--[protein]-cysteine S-methyltransferase n=1 Tax=Desulfosarcina alkanivorans TaxID=571177 RepID=A0A5K7YT51_9BACT|nr:methylated-DNA--[protein]-cysteine S-methyltransferase [Desulfosarcina alkanivorans]BBO69444.1 methylated-DNA--protein-cysteine methyltransferase [Desulfosarcina alkanivorans]